MTHPRDQQKKEILQKLSVWRSAKAKKEGLELFRILSNETLILLAEVRPMTKEGLLTIKGIKDKKYQRYGKEILQILAGTDIHSEDVLQSSVDKKGDSDIFTVSSYLDRVNETLSDCPAKIIGEVASVDIRGTYLFFKLKDKEDGSLISCFMWMTAYKMCGVILEDGLEIVLDGVPEVYKARGTFTVRVESLQYVGEGALKKAYEELKKKLEKEGLFDLGRKKPLEDYPHTIGLITSETGAVIHDFLNNIGKHGFKIQFFDSRVEGQFAVRDILNGLKYFRTRDIDTLVIIRGGGSLESLMAFNNEMVVREIASFPKPVLCGIGHDKDVPLACLTADIALSTPTAVAKALNYTWEHAGASFELYERQIFSSYNELLIRALHAIEKTKDTIEMRYKDIFDTFRDFSVKISLHLSQLRFLTQETVRQLGDCSGRLQKNFIAGLREKKDRLIAFEKSLQVNNPRRQLALGYSIVHSKGKIIRSIRDCNLAQLIDIQISDGTIISEVKEKKYGDSKN